MRVLPSILADAPAITCSLRYSPNAPPSVLAKGPVLPAPSVLVKGLRAPVHSVVVEGVSALS